MSLTKPTHPKAISTALTSTIAQFTNAQFNIPQVNASHLVIMGVSGCGKTSLGTELAAALGWPFFDADDFHPPENVAKMRAGVPLTDEDRAPWLSQLNVLLRANPHAVLACSALKSNYRDTLQAGLPDLRFIHPHGAWDVIAARIKARSLATGHYMPASLLTSQFEALEPCASALMVDIEMPRSERVNYVLGHLSSIMARDSSPPQSRLPAPP